jgi:nucleoside-diphosphate-sugar epimerase
MLAHRFFESVPPTRVVVLGANGFVASAVIRLLREEAISCRPVGAREIDLTLFDAAAKLREIVREEDSLVVVSALTPEKGRDRGTFFHNLRMIDHVCAVLEARRPEHVVYLSSDSVYSACSVPLTEESCCETGDLYGLSHLVREKLLADACRGGRPRLAILRPAAIYGSEDTHNSYGPNRFARGALSSGHIALFGQGEEERDHIYIRDVARLILMVLQHRSSGVLNAVSGNAISFQDIARIIVKAAGRPVALRVEPRRVPVVHRRFDTRALRTAFPDFRPTPFETGIRETMAELSAAKAWTTK